MLCDMFSISVLNITYNACSGFANNEVFRVGRVRPKSDEKKEVIRMIAEAGRILPLHKISMTGSKSMFVHDFSNLKKA